MKKSTKPKAAWTRAFPDQAKALRPENSSAGGVKVRSGSQEVRMHIYREIRNMFLRENDICTLCWRNSIKVTSAEVHHMRGRAGLILFDVRWFLPVCSVCHRWIHDNPAEATKLGLLNKI